jgi:hypothetical protein
MAFSFERRPSLERSNVMWSTSCLRKRNSSGPGPGSRPRGAPRKRAAFRPRLEALEDRALPSTLTVLNTLNSGAGSLRAEIAAANNGDTIVFAPRLGGQTITLASQLAVGKSVDIEGPSAAQLTVSGNNATRVFDIQSGAMVTIAGLTIAHGHVVADAGGGIRNEPGATLSLKNDVIANNTAFGIGGGLWNQIGASVNINNSVFAGNKAIGSLSFVYPDEGFTGDGTAEGGGIDSDGTAVISNSLFRNNVVQGVTGLSGVGGGAHGGALATDGTLTVTGCAFIDNMAQAGDGSSGGAGVAGGAGGQSEGGAINISVPLMVANVSNCTFIHNQSLGGNGGAGGSGANGGHGGVGAAGAISMADATLNLTNSTFVGNQAIGGTGGTGGAGGAGGTGGTGRGGAYVHTVTFGTSTPLSNLSNVVMVNNKAIGGAGGMGGVGGPGGNGGNGQGGAIRALLGTINVDNSSLIGNQARGGQGGAPGAGSSLGGNGGNGQGGGLLTAFGVTANLLDTALFLNQAIGGAGTSGGNGGNGQGGGIFNGGSSLFGTPDLNLFGCQIEFNQANGGAGASDGAGVGGGIFNLGTLAFDLATVIAHNHASTSNDDIFP